MSTKTTFKRIALVAAVALGLGGLSTVSANAAEATPTNIVISKTTTVSGDALAAGKYVADKLLNANGVSSITVGAGKAVVLKAIPVGGDSITGAKYRLVLNSAIWATSSALGADGTAGTAETAVSFTAPTTAGTYSASLIYDEDANFTATGDQRTAAFTFVVAAASGWSQGATTVLSAATHVAGTTTTDAVAKSAVKTLGTYVGTITATIKDTDGAAYTGQTVTATVSGVGFVGGASAASASDANIDTADGTATTTRSVSVTDTTGIVAFGVWADGLAGTSTVTISVTDKVSGATTVIGTKSFTFYGSVAKLALNSTVYSIGKAGGATTGAADGNLAARTAAHIPAFTVKTTDSAGNVANAVAVPTVVSDNLLAVTGGVCALDDNADADYSTGGTGYYNCNFVTAVTAKSGDKATLTIRIADPADATKYLSTTLAVTVGGSVAKETISFDKASYSPGEAMVITRTAVDASGNPVYDGADAPAITFNKGVGGTAPAASTYVGGKKATSATAPTVFAPAQSGEFTARATSGNAAGDVISATATVEDANANAATDAANEATDAANAATDAALAAADAADAATAAAQDASDAVAALSATVEKLVTSLKAQITSLTNLVIKIQKKVKA